MIVSDDSVAAWSSFGSLLVTFLVGVAAAAVALQSRNVAAASIVPFLRVREVLLKDKIEISIGDWGLGPAVIQSMRVAYPPVPHIIGVAAGLGKSLVQLRARPAIGLPSEGKHLTHSQHVLFLSLVNHVLYSGFLSGERQMTHAVGPHGAQHLSDLA